jgi:predicted molibdopterin-dependent oxidoreductase YjgC
VKTKTAATSKTLTLTIDNRRLEAEPGATILDVARQHEIWIPTLCHHEDLPPHGGCRMCIVEVEGMRNLPTACTTPVAEGMVVRTDTTQVQEIRREILQLFMSEHTSSCLICKEAECTEFSPSIRKVGVTTGCRTCPKDGQCEFQDVVEKLDVRDIDFPLSYRALRVETEDPFYDRDYNLCILCGRCVRICQDVRTADVLAFKDSGRATVIGPAWGRTHLEAGCEFCGACVSVCPTGTLTEKARKWEGKPDAETRSTCSFCGVGCGVRLLRKDDQVYRSLPDGASPVNDGQLCVKGRFGVSELVHHYRRLQFPRRFELGHSAPIEWEEAITRVVALLEACPPEDFGMLLSPNATTEDLYVAQKFTREVMRSDNVDTSARLFYGAAFDAYAALLGVGGTLADLAGASAVLCVGLDARYGRSVVNVALRHAAKQGVPVFTIHPRPHGLALVEDLWLQPRPGEEAELLEALATATGRGGAKTALADLAGVPGADQQELAARLRAAARRGQVVIVLGSELLAGSEAARALGALRDLAAHTRARVLALPAQNNLVGSLLAGGYRELLPGARPSGAGPGWTALDLVTGARRRKVLYTLEALPEGVPRPAEAIVHQNIFPPALADDADLLLPAAAFTETSGTYVNGEGRVQRVTAAVPPRAAAQPDWLILARTARAMGAEGFAYESVEDIRAEMAACLPRIATGDTQAQALPPLPPLAGPKTRALKAKTGRARPLWLSVAWEENTHRGAPLADHVDGAAILWVDAVLEASPDDAASFDLADGEPVVVSNGKSEWTWPLRVRDEQPPGSLRVVLPAGTWSQPNPQPVSLRRP